MEEFERSGEIIVELGSDQTSCHNPFNGGYYPIQLNFEEAQEVTIIINAGSLNSYTVNAQPTLLRKILRDTVRLFRSRALTLELRHSVSPGSPSPFAGKKAKGICCEDLFQGHLPSPVMNTKRAGV